MLLWGSLMGVFSWDIPLISVSNLPHFWGTIGHTNVSNYVVSHKGPSQGPPQFKAKVIGGHDTGSYCTKVFQFFPEVIVQKWFREFIGQKCQLCQNRHFGRFDTI